MYYGTLGQVKEHRGLFSTKTSGERGSGMGTEDACKNVSDKVFAPIIYHKHRARGREGNPRKNWPILLGNYRCIASQKL